MCTVAEALQAGGRQEPVAELSVAGKSSFPPLFAALKSPSLAALRLG